MRFQMFDRITEYEKGKSIEGLKQVSRESGNILSFNGTMYYPHTLAIEALAQLGGWFISASKDFTLLVVLAMIVNARIHFDIKIGDELILKAHLIELKDENSVLRGEIWREKECAIQVQKIVYGIVKVEEERYRDEQMKIFSSLLQK